MVQPKILGDITPCLPKSRKESTASAVPVPLYIWKSIAKSARVEETGVGDRAHHESPASHWIE